MLKLIESYTINGLTVEIFQTRHTGPDFHVRYGLQVKYFDSLFEARTEFGNCMIHARQCEEVVT